MKRRVTKEEGQLWQRVVANVEPIDRDRVLPAPARLPPEPAGPVARLDRVITEMPPLPRTLAVMKPAPSPTPPAVDRRTAQRLKRGQIAIDGRIDLHGMTKNQAYSALLRFINASIDRNRRMVLVVTGKGWNPEAEHPQEAVGVLRRNVPRWLESPPFTKAVAAVTDAHAKHGGSGALYVLLRRHRRAK